MPCQACLVQNVEYISIDRVLSLQRLSVFDNKIYQPPYLHTKDNIHENLDSSALIFRVYANCPYSGGLHIIIKVIEEKTVILSCHKHGHKCTAFDVFVHLGLGSKNRTFVCVT